ncbi:MAG: LacI family DNA-binding transcriptional regulator [Planctomycetota bacterium]|nr:LacI family DNA-binding transcriptional regulator [Planctomycetota bacterium]
MERVTLNTIAEVCGLSRPTISQILNGKGWYREDTRARVLAAADRLGYRKNAAAQSVITGSMHTIGLMLAPSDRDSLLPGGLLAGIEAGVGQHGFLLSLARLPDRDELANGYTPRILEQIVADGLLVLYNARVPEAVASMIDSHRVPVIWLNDRRPSNAIYPDDVMAGRVASECLIEAGHTRIAWCSLTWARGVKPGHYSGVDRREGYLAAMRAARLEPRELVPEQQLVPDQRVAWLRAQLAQPDRPTGLVCYSGEIAHAAYAAALGLGLVPGVDVSIVSIDEKAKSPIGMTFTTACLPFPAMGRLAVKQLITRLDDDAVADSTAVPVELVPGDTVGPPA